MVRLGTSEIVEAFVSGARLLLGPPADGFTMPAQGCSISRRERQSGRVATGSPYQSEPEAA
jgi:hypothetical protein